MIGTIIGPYRVVREVGRGGMGAVYLAERADRFLPRAPHARMATLEWLMWQMGGFGPMLGQAGHFLRHGEKIPYAIERYVNAMNDLEVEAERLSHPSCYCNRTIIECGAPDKR